MKTHQIFLRLDEEDYRAVSKEAERANTSNAGLVRTFVHQGLAGFDPHKEELSRKMIQLEKTVAEVKELVALVATLVLALDVPRKPDERVTEMSGHLKQGSSMVEGVLEGQRRGLFKN
jgi:hypothetical protein